MRFDWEQIADRLNLSKETVQHLVRWAVRAGLVVGGAYVLASFVSAYLMSGMMTSALAAFNRLSTKQVAAASINLSTQDNYRDIEKAIKDRNLFNSTGEFPDESNPDAKKDDKKSGTFDINAPCSKATFNAELVGTIFIDGGTSVATLQESGYSESDIYKEGDAIVGNENAAIVKIERNRVIINNNGVKECLELASAVKGLKKDPQGFPEVGSTSPNPSPTPTPDSPAPAGGSDCAFDEKYVQDELGPGFGTIIQKARLVPNTTDAQMNGFKIFAIDQSSLLGKTGLQNGDIITQVNETSLKQPEQGFTLYQAFQDEREVRIHILRRGTTPMTITCRIK